MEDDSTTKDFILAGELAKIAGVSTDSLRHYERKKVLTRPARGRNGYRLYSQAAVARVGLIRRALAVGFTLDELAVVLAERDKGDAPCRQVHGLAIRKLQAIEDQIEALTSMQEMLTNILRDWTERMAGNGTAPRHLLESLPDRTDGAKRLPDLKKKVGKI